MTTFISGPAQGVTLSLRRAPILLRVTRSRMGAWDALDQLGDEPTETETIFVYRLTKPSSQYHILIRGKGRGGTGWYANAEYGFLMLQPEDKDIRTNAAWHVWRDANLDRLMPDWARKPATETGDVP